MGPTNCLVKVICRAKDNLISFTYFTSNLSFCKGSLCRVIFSSGLPLVLFPKAQPSFNIYSLYAVIWVVSVHLAKILQKIVAKSKFNLTENNSLKVHLPYIYPEDLSSRFLIPFFCLIIFQKGKATDNGRIFFTLKNYLFFQIFSYRFVIGENFW